MNIEKIRDFLNNAEGVTDWQLRHVSRDNTTIIRLPGIYTIKDGRFLREPNPHPREVITAPSETVQINVYSEFKADGSTWRGDTIGQLTSDDPAALKPVVDSLVDGARSQKNKPYPLTDGSERYPEVELADPELADLDAPGLTGLTQRFNDGVVAAAERLERVDVSNIELFVRRTRTRVLTSTGVSVGSTSTRVDVELCFLARPDDIHFGEHTARLTARRLGDLEPDAIVAEAGTMARDIALAGAPPAWQGPVVLLGEAAADALTVTNTPAGFHANARFVYEKAARYKKGKPVSGETSIKGEPLTLISDPLVPFGVRSSVMSDADATAARPVTIIKDGLYADLLGSRRFYAYLGLLERGIAPPGITGNTVVPAGPAPVDSLASDGSIVIRAFSDFDVDAASGDFSCEIRLGEIHSGGHRKLFKGGLLVGNWFDAIGDANYSKETQVRGAYRGPRAVRFNDLKVTD